MSAHLICLQKKIQNRKNQVWLLLVIIAGLIIRLPRVAGIFGSDAFIVLWMGRAISEGALTNWLLTPFSLFGLFPFASYPIGIPALLAGLFQLGFDLEGAVLLISMCCSIIGTIGAYRLGKNLFGDANKGLIFATFYTFSQIFLRFTYYTISTRGPFMALLPFLMYYGINYLKRRERLDLRILIALWSVFVLIHPLALFLILYPLVALIFLIMSIVRRIFLGSRLGTDISNDTDSKWWNHSLVRSIYRIITKAIDVAKNFEIVLFLVLIGASFLVGLEILPFDEHKTTPFILTNDTLIGVAMNLIIDYGIRLGILSIFLPIGLLICFRDSSYSGAKFLHLLLGLLLAFTIPTSLYTSVILFPIFAYYSVAGFIFSKRWLSDTAIAGALLVFLVPFSYLYTSYVVTLPTWILLSVATTAIMFPIAILTLRIIRKFISTPMKLKNPVNTGFIFLIVVVFSLLCTEGMLLQNTRWGMSEDEFTIISIIGEDFEGGLVFVPDHVIGRRMHTFGIPAIGASNEDASLYFGWIEPEEIIAGSHFDINSFLVNGKPFFYDGRKPERELVSSLLQLDLTSLESYSIAYALGLRYVVVEKNSQGFKSTYHSVSGYVHSLLLQTAPSACELIYDGTDLSLFRLV